MTQIFLEQEILWRSLNKHPTVLIQGSSFTAIQRFKETLVRFQTESKESQDAEFIWKGDHPDVTIYDCREINTEETRELKDGLSQHPARLSKKYLVLGNVDKLHNTATQTLLKLIEEPPEKLNIIVITNLPYILPETVLSRSILVRVRNPSVEVISEYLKEVNVEDYNWRAYASFGDVDRSLELDVAITREWHKQLSSVATGNQIDPAFSYLWATRLTGDKVTESTKLSCLDILIQIATRKPDVIYWRETALKAMEERENIYTKRSTKLTLGTLMTGIYAQLKTAICRSK
jgi:DNA polymerase-3 subunit delta'